MNQLYLEKSWYRAGNIKLNSFKRENLHLQAIQNKI
jgi:hypothetical protein